jgi:enamine deaminase RidA (YjgF/YER057c/UK114 family)
VPISGFSHAIRAAGGGDLLFVSGLTARTADGTIVHPGDLGAQARQVLENMRAVLREAGASLRDVVQIRTYVRDIEQWPAVQAVWPEYWGAVWPASTLVEISRLYDARQLIEMEAIARLPGRLATRQVSVRPGRRPREARQGGKR